MPYKNKADEAARSRRRRAEQKRLIETLMQQLHQARGEQLMFIVRPRQEGKTLNAKP